MSNVGNIAAIPDSTTRTCVDLLQRRQETIENLLQLVVKNSSLRISYADLDDLPSAGSGLTGGVTSFDVGAGTGISVAADSVAVNQAFAPTWTGIHTFSAEAVFNAGLDIGTSGRFDSNVADAVGAFNFLFKPTTTMSEGTDRAVFEVQTSAGETILSCHENFNDNSVAILTQVGGSRGAEAVLSISGITPKSEGIFLNPFFKGSSGSAYGGFATGTMTGIKFLAGVDSSNPLSVTQIVGAYLAVNTGEGMANAHDYITCSVAQITTAGGEGSETANDYYGYWVPVWNFGGAAAKQLRNVTNMHGLRIDDFGWGTSKCTNAYGIYLEAIVSGGTINNEIFIESDGGVWFRDQALYVNSDADGFLDLHGDTAVRINDDLRIVGDLDHDGSNVGFYAVAPAARPSAYTQTYATATRTHSNPTGASITDNSGGTATQTIAAITGGGSACENATKDAVASLADEVNKLVTDMANVKQVVNQVIDDMQANGLLQ